MIEGISEIAKLWQKINYMIGLYLTGYVSSWKLSSEYRKKMVQKQQVVIKTI